jgi:hypothetical protein
MVEETPAQDTELDLGKLLGFKHHAASAGAVALSGVAAPEHLAKMLGATCNKIGGSEVPLD